LREERKGVKEGETEQKSYEARRPRRERVTYLIRPSWGKADNNQRGKPEYAFSSKKSPQGKKKRSKGFHTDDRGDFALLFLYPQASPYSKRSSRPNNLVKPPIDM